MITDYKQTLPVTKYDFDCVSNNLVYYSFYFY
jgi:hypothetical protein